MTGSGPSDKVARRNATVKGEDHVTYAGHDTYVGTFIVGIDPQKFSDSRLDPCVQKRIKTLEEEYKGKTVIIGVDRLDHTKGLVQKLEGYGGFLKQHPELSNKVTLIQVAIPSREDVKEYQNLADEVNTLVGRIDGTYGGSPRTFSSSIPGEGVHANGMSSNPRWHTTRLYAPLRLVHGIDGAVLHSRYLPADFPPGRHEPCGIGVRRVSGRPTRRAGLVGVGGGCVVHEDRWHHLPSVAGAGDVRRDLSGRYDGCRRAGEKT